MHGTVAACKNKHLYCDQIDDEDGVIIIDVNIIVKSSVLGPLRGREQ